MKNLTLLFPGQGSQYVGMGANLADEFKNYFFEADKALGYSLSNLCFEGPEEALKLTQNTQPAIVTHSFALFKKLEKFLENKNAQISCVLGHSVGEYSALLAAQSLKFSDAIKAVNSRGIFMQEATPVGVGAMYAILKVPGEIIEKACKESTEGKNQCMPANFNEPNQTVISGHKAACQRAIAIIEKETGGNFRAVELPVSAPFHSTLMKPAEEKLTKFFHTISFEKNIFPYIANIDSDLKLAQTSGETIKQNLIKQVCGSVLWCQSILKLPENTICLEVGPGNVLTGLNRRINKNLSTIALDSEGAFEKLEEILK
jgi:[acyl-carrier-protein] S-malonyltransferase